MLRLNVNTVALAFLLSACVPINVQTGQAEGVRGCEFAATMNLVPKDVKAEASVFIPQKEMSRTQWTKVDSATIRRGKGGENDVFWAPVSCKS